MKIGIYGGTFNPPHRGHVAAARAAMELLKLDRLLLIPAGIPPHKTLPSGSASPQQRLEMTRLAAESLGPKAEVLDLELRRQGKSFTSDTLAQLKAQYPEDELWLLMGTDMFLSLHTWHAPEEILSLAGVAAFSRSKGDVEASFDAQRQALYRAYPNARIFTMTIPDVVEVSSTELRQRLGRGEGAELLLPAVYGYILRQGLYDTHADLKHLSIGQLRPVALSYLKYTRIPHVLGTEQEAVHLALRYGADPVKARRAALLHDCTKRLRLEEQLALCQTYHIATDEMERTSAALLHSKTAAAIAQHVFGEPEDVCSAIRYHTTGRRDMTLLEKILYIADYMEPSRDFPGVAALRRQVYEDLDRGVLMGMENTIALTAQRGASLHPSTVEARNFLRERIEIPRGEP